jgi:hypothetical protein
MVAACDNLPHTSAHRSSALPWQVIYAKDGVSIRPTRSEAIAGRLSILRQQRMVFLAWLPYSQGCLQVLVSVQLALPNVHT